MKTLTDVRKTVETGVDPRLEGLHSASRRLVITKEEKARVFEECHSAPFSGHAGRDNTFAPCEGCSQGVVLGRN